MPRHLPWSCRAFPGPAAVGLALLLCGSLAFGQQQVNLSAGPTSATLPDGSAVPMWGYSCGAAVPGSTATCAALNPGAGAGWSPVLLTVPAGQGLTINLGNNLSFLPSGAATPNSVPTSIVIVGQLGAGLGSSASSTPSPYHAPAGITWSTVNTPGGTNPTFTPPPQGPRVQSFSAEVATATTVALTWPALRPGTYLLESGTHPSIQGPMGLYGILVVTFVPTAAGGVETAPGTAYPGVGYDAEVPLLMSEIDPVQNQAVSSAVNTAGFSEAAVWSGQPGQCGNPSSPNFGSCYPPAVNYSPRYYLFNGVAFDRTNPGASLFAATPQVLAPASGSGSVLVRLANAGLRMHVPSIVGALTGGVAVPGFTLVAEDGFPIAGPPRVQSEVFLAAGKTYDVMVNGISAGASALPVYDRELSLSGNATARDAGMLAYLGINGTGVPAAAGFGAAVARADAYNALVPCPASPCQALMVTDPAKGVIANDTNVRGVQLLAPPTGGSVDLRPDGTFIYVPSPGTSADSFSYCANGTVVGTVCSSGLSAVVTLGPATIEASSGIQVNPITFQANTATYLAVKSPGVLAVDSDSLGLPLTVASATVQPVPGLTVVPDANGGFTAVAPGAGTYTFTYRAQNSQGTLSAPATVTLVFPAGSGLQVTVLDGRDQTTQISDYRWIIEEDRTFYVDPTRSTNNGTAIVPTLGVNFHTSYMPFVAQGCTGPVSCGSGQAVVDPATGAHVNAVCDVGNGVCRADTTGAGTTAVQPSQVALDPTRRYYLSVLPGDAANPFYNASPTGHGMGGAPIGIDPYTHLQQAAVTVLTQPSPYPTARLSVFVFEDDFPLNGEQDGGGGTGAVNTNNEPGLGGFQIHLWDAMGGNGDFTGQMSYDMFNQPLANGLAGTLDPVTGNDACPISKYPLNPADPGATGISGMIVTCPAFESDGVTPSPLAGQAVIDNLMPGRFGVIATPAADRIARGEEWLQTNTLDGQKAHDSFARIGEPAYFQEFGPAGYHVSIGFANPAIINGRHAGVCNGSDPNITGTNCTNAITGRVTGQRLSRTPDERLYSSGSHDAFYWSQCYVSFGDPDGEDFAFTKCNGDGTFTLTGLPDGDWRVTIFDQWNDQLVDGLSTPVRLAGGTTTDLGDVASTQWQTNLYTRTFIDDNRDGRSQSTEAGIPFANVAVRLRDGSLENLLVTDFTGTANFNETFPLFSWYTVETDVTRYKNTGTHVVYDAGGPADGSPACGQAGYPPCGSSSIGRFLANTAEQVSVPLELRVPGAVYCADADCSSKSIQAPASDPPSACTTAPGGATTCSTILSTGRIDPPWVGVEGWQGFPGQSNFIEFGKEPYVQGENGGIKGHVVYASTRPFDDPQMLVQTQWEPLVPNVTVNLYQEGYAADGITPTLTLVDTTRTSSWDDWAQGFHLAADGASRIPNMNCPGQGRADGVLPDLFFFSLYQQPDYLDVYRALHGGAAATPLPYDAQFKCYDGMHNWNQIQPAPYDGMYAFPSVSAVDPVSGRPSATNCKVCGPDPVAAPDLYAGLPMLPPGKYVVEVVLPPGFELVKEEDKNILIGDNFIAPATQQFGALGSVFILPDQASIAAAYNANNAQNPTNSLGTQPANGIVPGFVPEPVWPCAGEARIVPDYISLYPQSRQVAPFAGATRRLCDRKEVTLGDQMGAIAKFYIYTSTHVASKFTGGITDDYTSEFDPFSPQFGEKFAPPDLPVAVRDWTGAEISRVYADHWGAYDGMTYSTWEVNPPNPTGYSPTMMVFCMNDPGPITDTRPTIVNAAGQVVANPTLGQPITDPAFAQGYSQFCYELPFMPGTTQYLDTPVVPTSAFAGAGYNNVDCAYPTLTPAIKEVDGDGVGPWIAAPGEDHPITITALGDQDVPNYAYSGPSATSAPFNQKTISRHYGFGRYCEEAEGEGGSCSTRSGVTIGGVPARIRSWSDTLIVVEAPSTVPACGLQQQVQYGGAPAQCGELAIVAGNGRRSVDTVTVTIGGKPPVHVAAAGSIQAAIDAAAPGDLIIVDPSCTTGTGAAACTVAGQTHGSAAHNELLLMWKPVRLQGAGAASSLINANTHPAGKLDPWRQRVNCLFGLALNGTPVSATNAFDPTGAVSCGSTNGTPWAYFSAFGTAANPFNPQVDRLPLEATVGWDASLNGNLAELLQEPSLMGALEGAGVTVLAKGVNFPANPFAGSLAAGFPAGTNLLTAADCSTGPGGSNPFPSNFQCNPSSIDGLGITNSSQGGGGIFVHAWGHNLEIANNRIYNNAGTLSGGINVGQGEYPPANVQGGAANAPPGSCQASAVPNAVLPYCFNLAVNVHNNNVSLNSSTGDELFSATPAGAGGVSFCTGDDYYRFNYNWVCGNLSSGDGGGLGHLGFSYNGDIEHNAILFNQSTNPTIPANGGGIIVMGTPDADVVCNGNASIDADCVPVPLSSVGPSDGVGPGLVINANLVMGNAAESGSGGGIAFQAVNGSDVVSFPTTPAQWNSVTVTNNIIVDNVAGWDGAGISLLDSFSVSIVNNTIANNVSTASAGVLFNTLGAPLASTPPPPGLACTSNCGTTSPPQPAGLVAIQNSAILAANLPATVVCPDGHGSGGSGDGGRTNGACRSFSVPLLANDVFWHNSSYYIGVGALSPAFQQNVVMLYNAFTANLAPNQTATGACMPASYWDLGVRGDAGPGNHAGGLLAPTWSVLTDAADYPGLNNLGTDPAFLQSYCDGSRVPPEACTGAGGCGWQVPPGIADATVPNPVFNLTPAATVDEGNNWVNMRWGPLSMVDPITSSLLGNYALAPRSPGIDAVPDSSPTFALGPATDFFGNPRPDPNNPHAMDIGAVEFQGGEGGGGAAAALRVLASIVPNAGVAGTAVAVTLAGTNLAGVSSVRVSGGGVSVSNVTVVDANTLSATFTIAPGSAPTQRNVRVFFPSGRTNAATFTVQ